METPELSFTLAYWVFCLCFVFTPNEFRSAGLTVQNLFSSWLGSEDMGFIQYHIRRSSVTALVHSGLPLGYYLGMCLAAPEQHTEHILEAWQLYLMVAILVHVGAWTLVMYWSMWNWQQHPITTAAQLNTEFRRVDKFTAGVHGARVIVTDSWFKQRQDNHGLYLPVPGERGALPAARPVPRLLLPTQMLTLRVDSSNRAVHPFHFRLNATEFSELRDKLHVPIRNSSNVVIYQSVSERFLETFRAHVRLNQPYDLPSGQVSLYQTHAHAHTMMECQRCLCRPMWCVSCVGRWFASRQDQQQPETWLSSRVPCPTCRARFCILDVCMVPSTS
uniref:Transmembrane protein 129, E3 ubiquitin protein ligase n=1 Tax=Neogobius melanostomus TaxID=47308 RepID=A0A8C6SLR3_9GOBI